MYGLPRSVSPRARSPRPSVSCAPSVSPAHSRGSEGHDDPAPCDATPGAERLPVLLSRAPTPEPTVWRRSPSVSCDAIESTVACAAPLALPAASQLVPVPPTQSRLPVDARRCTFRRLAFNAHEAGIPRRQSHPPVASGLTACALGGDSDENRSPRPAGHGIGANRKAPPPALPCRATGPQFAVIPVQAMEYPQKIAMLMSGHARLGAGSPAGLRALSSSLFNVIFSFAGGTTRIPLHTVAQRLHAKDRRLLSASRRVTRVHHRPTDVTLALKPFPWRLITDPAAQRFDVQTANAMMRALATAYSAVGPCLLPCYGVVNVETQFCLVLRHAGAGSLADLLSQRPHPLPERVTAAIIFQCLLGLAAYATFWAGRPCPCGRQCPAAECVDTLTVRPGRVLVDPSGDVFLSGFPCGPVGERKLESHVGGAQLRKAWFYSGSVFASAAAPHGGILAARHPRDYSPVFSVGVVAYQCLTGIGPERIVNWRPLAPAALDIDAAHTATAPGQAFLRACLQSPRAARPDPAALLQHEWMRSHGLHTHADATAAVREWVQGEPAV